MSDAVCGTEDLFGIPRPPQLYDDPSARNGGRYPAFAATFFLFTKNVLLYIITL